MAQQPSPAPVDDSHGFLQRHGTARRSDPPELSARVRDLLSRMTLKEKVGQMTQLEIGMIADGKDQALRINPAKLRKAVVEYGVGSILNVFEEALPVERWREIITEIQAAARETRLQIPVLYGIDTIHGANYILGATLFPQPLGMAATWNPQLMLEGSRVAAAETRAAAIPWNFSPVLDVGRQPLWPRLWETFGEDVYLATVMGVATVRGYEGDNPAAADRVASSLKHYVGYSYPTTGHDRTPALIPEITMREYFLPPFAAAVRAGALSVMVNSGEVNGIPGHVNTWLLKDVLRGEMGFDGVVVSDWEDIRKLVNIHRVAATEKDATRIAVMAGIDMSMVPSAYSFSDLLVELVEEGTVPMARIDEAVTRILTMKGRVGLFEEPLRGAQAATEVGSAASRKLALEAARESLILLKNDASALPLARSARILVTGPAADSMPALSNGWTLTWQGNRDKLYPADRPTIRRALEQRLGAGQVTYVAGADFEKEIDVNAAVSAAGAADAIVLCLGESSYAETPGNIDDLSLPAAQVRLADALARTGKPIVLVLVEGRPRIVRTIVDHARAILLALNPSLEGGTAIADVLLGEINPSGKLPITYPRYPNALRTYDHKAFEEQDTSFGFKAFQPQFEFGFGLGYSTFEYSGLRVQPGASNTTVSVTVANTGKRAGAEVVQLYAAPAVSSVTPPVKRLRRFIKIPLEAGERREVRFTLTHDDLSFVGPDGTRVMEPGVFVINAGTLREEVTLR
jgi:beta-glucosidase